MTILAYNDGIDPLVTLTGVFVFGLIISAVVTSGMTRAKEDAQRRKKAARARAKGWLRDSEEERNQRAEQVSE